MARSLRRLEMLQAFRKYARLGLSRTQTPTHLIYARLRGVSRTEREARNLLAVYDTVRLLRLERSPALQVVYDILFDPLLPFRRKNEMTWAVRRYAAARHYDERTVYRQLERIERMYLSLRTAAEEMEE